MKIVLIGQGGHSKVIKDIILSAEENEIAAYLDDKFSELKTVEQSITGPTEAAADLISYWGDVKFIIAIGSNSVRKKMKERLNLPDEYYATVIHRTACISYSAIIGRGTVIMPNAVVNADSQIGNHAIINSCAVVEHDNCIGNYTHISPNATLAGNVTVEEGVHIGSGATVIPGKTIRQWAVIGAGATVINDVPQYRTAVGVPAKVLRKEGEVLVNISTKKNLPLAASYERK
ncbi:acetyltransferase [Evansella clarkii]|uniref:acetyltransferase n=1 Tax=Evansella clarkii TaxID=79879 RepID=UPI000998D5FE|nr:acetyltransferase [Evansella clarkii]